jgi:hypothetical protein
MQTLRIEIPKGFVIDSIDKESGVIKLTEQPKNITERIKTVDDVLAWHNLDKASWARSCADLTDDEKAYRLLKLLAKALNQGWTPDWNNHNEYKYYPWFEMGGSPGFRFSAPVTGLRFRVSARAFALSAKKLPTTSRSSLLTCTAITL